MIDVTPFVNPFAQPKKEEVVEVVIHGKTYKKVVKK